MNTKTIMCPQCKTKFTIQGNSGEKIQVVCPSCGVKGVFTFSIDPTKSTITHDSYAVEINDLTKKFKDLVAVNNLSLNVKKGEIFGLLGPNGAGKSTTIKSVLGLIHTNSGEIKINGFDIIKKGIDARASVGYLPERVAFYDNLTPLQTMNFLSELWGVDKSVSKPLLKEVGLEGAMNRKVGTFSKGMVQLLGVAQVMIGNPPVYILDEPMGGLDARWVKIIREKIKILNKQGATILFSSHILSEVENLCHRVAIINKGKLIAEDTVANLNKYLQIKPRLEISIPGLNGEVPDIIKNIEGVEVANAKNDTLFITCESYAKSKIIAILQNSGMTIDNIKTLEPSLEDAFVKLIERDA